MTDKKTGIELIAEERQRQIERWGNTEAHDVIHDDGQLLRAALSYLDNNRDYEESYADEFDDRESRAEKEANPVFKNSHWPWKDEEFKPKREVYCHPEIRDLVKAATLIAAEIDRLQNIPNE